MELAELRKEYRRKGLRREEMEEDALRQFAQWFEVARQGNLLEPNAMILATASADARPTVRTVLLKAFNARGLVFFTNYTSNKARQIEDNPNVSLLFLWLALERQVSITGKATKISPEESLEYFSSRPLGSRLSAWASKQSQAIPSRKTLEMRLTEIESKYADGEVPRPSFWGGYRVDPLTIEFWQGRENRLHDRFLYSRQKDHSWKLERLAP